MTAVWFVQSDFKSAHPGESRDILHRQIKILAFYSTKWKRKKELVANQKEQNDQPAAVHFLVLAIASIKPCQD